MAGERNHSIHPRVWGDFEQREKLNTCGAKKKSTVQRAIAGIKGHLEHHPRDAMSQSRLVKLNSRLASMPAGQS